MNSMLRQNHIRLKDLLPYLRRYDPAQSMLPEEWARLESESCEPGMLIFCLDPVTAVPGLTFTRKEPEIAEIYRVKDLCILVGHDDGRALAINITTSAYELRFLEVLLLEKARKAILDSREFLYVAAKPIQKLNEAQAKEIEQLGTLYAQGGSRRSVTIDSASPQEPALALLSALGANITLTGISKQVLDIGSVCHMLFTPEGRQEDRNKTVLRSQFTLIPNSHIPSSQALAEPQPILAQQEGLLSEKGDQMFDSGLNLGELPQQASLSTTQFEQLETSSSDFSASVPNFSENQPIPEGTACETGPLQDASDSYKHLAEALSSLINDPEQTASSEVQPETQDIEETVDSNQAINQTEHSTASPSEPYEYVPSEEDSSIESLFSIEGQSAEATLHTIPSSFDDTEVESTNTWTLESDVLNLNEDFRTRAITIEQESSPDIISDDSTIEAHSLALEAEEETILPAGSGERIPEPAQSVQRVTSPRAIMHEMVTLTNKLEQQVARATKRLAGKVEEAKRKLNMQVDAWIEEAAQSGKERQDAVAERSLEFNKKLDNLEEQIRLKCSDITQGGREVIKQLLLGHQSQLSTEEGNLSESLLNALRDFPVATEALVRASTSKLEELVHERTQEIEKLIDTSGEHLRELKQTYISKFDLRLERFKERMSDEMTALGDSLERNAKSMVEEIDGSLDRASDKLKSAKSDFEHAVDYTVKISELQISERVRRLLITALSPRLRERKEMLKEMSVQMSQRFSEESLSQVRLQSLGLESSVTNATQKLNALIEDCLSDINDVGTKQQASLEEIFDETNRYAEKLTSETQLILEQAENQIAETDMLSKQLVEDSSIERDQVLSEEHETVKSTVQQLKDKAYSELEAAIDLKCSELDKLSEVSQNGLAARRLEETQALRQAAEAALTAAREAIQEAFSAIAATREKYME